MATRRAAYFGMLAASAGIMVLFPLFPALQLTLNLPTQAIGFVAAAGFGATLLVELLIAPQADRGRARLMAVSGMILVALSLVLSGLSVEAWQLIAARAVGGVGIGLFLASASALLIRSNPGRSGELLGRLGAAELAGISIGPLFSALGLEIAAPTAIFFASAALVGLSAIVVAIWVREEPRTGEVEHPPALAFDLLRSRFVVGALLLQVAVMIPVGAYDAIWPRYMDDIGSTPLLTAASYTLFAIPYVLLAGWAGRMADRLGGARAYARGVLVLIVTISLYGFVTNPWIATGLGFVESTGQALAFVGAATAMAQIVVPARAASGQGISRAFGLLAATIASALSGIVYTDIGVLALFVGTAVIVSATSIIALLLLRRSAATRASVGTLDTSRSGSGAGSAVAPAHSPDTRPHDRIADTPPRETPPPGAAPDSAP